MNSALRPFSLPLSPVSQPSFNSGDVSPSSPPDQQQVVPVAMDRIFEHDVPEGYREMWTRRVAAPEHPSRRDGEAVVAFRCGTEWFALPAEAIRKITTPRPVHGIPHRRGSIRGVVNLHGELVLCIDIRSLLGLGTEEGGTAAEERFWPRMMRVGRRGKEVVFEVDEVRAGLEVFASELQPLPVTVALGAGPCALGLWNWEGRSVGMLYEPHLLEAIDRSLS